MKSKRSIPETLENKNRKPSQIGVKCDSFFLFLPLSLFFSLSVATNLHICVVRIILFLSMFCGSNSFFIFAFAQQFATCAAQWRVSFFFFCFSPTSPFYDEPKFFECCVRYGNRKKCVPQITSRLFLRRCSSCFASLRWSQLNGISSVSFSDCRMGFCIPKSGSKYVGRPSCTHFLRGGNSIRKSTFFTAQSVYYVWALKYLCTALESIRLSALSRGSRSLGSCWGNDDVCLFCWRARRCLQTSVWGNPKKLLSKKEKKNLNEKIADDTTSWKAFGDFRVGVAASKVAEKNGEESSGSVGR